MARKDRPVRLEPWPTRSELQSAFWEWLAWILASSILGALCGMGLALVFGVYVLEVWHGR